MKGTGGFSRLGNIWRIEINSANLTRLRSVMYVLIKENGYRRKEE